MPPRGAAPATPPGVSRVPREHPTPGTGSSAANDDDEGPVLSPEQLEKEARQQGIPVLPSRGAEAPPLPEDMADIPTRKEVRERASSNKTKARKANTTMEQYGVARRKWMTKFCKWAGWDYEKTMVLICPETHKIRDGTFRWFIFFLHQNPAMTKSILKNCLAFLQFELVAQGEKLKVRVPAGYVVELPGVRAMKEEIYAKARTQKLELAADLHASVVCDIGKEKMFEMCDYLLSMKLLQKERNALLTFQTYFELRATHQHFARHDHLRDEMLNMMLTRPTDRLGPTDFKMNIFMNISDGGKTNTNGNLVYCASIPARNPILCVQLSRACLLVYRFRCMGEAFPSIVDHADLASRYVLRQIGDPKKGIDGPSSYNIHKAMYESHAVRTVKILHQGRREGEMSADDGGVDARN